MTEMSPESAEIIAEIAEIDDNILLADGFEDAIVGYAEVLGRVVALYDKKKCIEILQAQGLDEEAASEHFAFNVAGACAGELTPAFATFLRR